ncbi:MAG: hypothetical protein ACJ74Z_20065 [Bryobacteraceae bacterium]
MNISPVVEGRAKRSFGSSLRLSSYPTFSQTRSMLNPVRPVDGPVQALNLEELG